ncbi:MAG: MATE family efflux transporter, partial [Pseudomonadota bacterium]
GLFRLTYPLFLFSFMSIGVTFIDQILLANYSDDLAAAVSLANQILGVFYDVSGLFAVGMLIIVAQYLGRNEVDRARAVVLVGLQASLGLCLVLSSILLVGAPAFADWINTPEAIRADVIAYTWVIAGAMLFNGTIVTATAALRGFGHTLPIFVLGALANVIYLVLQYGLIFGELGFPELGVYGAALSTLIVRIGMILVLLIYLKQRIGIRLFQVPADVVSRSWTLIRISYPSVTQNMVYNLYQLGMLSLITVLGTSAVVTRSYTLTIVSLLSIISVVIAQGTEVLIGYDRGADDHDAAFRRALRNAVITGAVNFFGALILLWQADLLIGLFTDDPVVVEGIRQLLVLNLIVTPLTTINLIIFSALKAVGDVNRPVLWNLSLTILIALPLGYVAVSVLNLGLVGLWYAYIAEELLKAAAMLTLWLRRRWQRYQLLEPDPARATS